MVLVDTSVWVDHFRRGLPLLEELLQSAQVAIHPFIIGEIACGGLTKISLNVSQNICVFGQFWWNTKKTSESVILAEL